MAGRKSTLESMERLDTYFWQGKRVFITGATGIVGSWLVKELLTKGADVIALIHDGDPQSELYRSGDIDRISAIRGSLEDFSTLERAINKHEIDTVFHLGAQTIVGAANRSPLPTFEANIRGTYNLLEACRIHSNLVKRVVIASSDKAYGDSEVLPYKEDMPLLGRHPYDVSKSCTDLISQTYYHTYGMPVAIARCGNIYGGADLNWSRIVPGTIRSFLQGEAPIIRSDGTYVRDYIYVKDVTQAYIRLAECLTDFQVQGQGFNFSLESPMTVLELVKVIQQLMNCEHIKLDIRNQAKAEIRSQYLAAEKARNLLQWQPIFSLEKGLLETISWYKDFLTMTK
ncbi:MAG TPA: GDP-mannose 4,6-dehydratase [Leptolyngbyaceae cyanobacterium]